MNKNQIRGESVCEVVFTIMGFVTLLVIFGFAFRSIGYADGKRAMELEAVKNGNGEYVQEEQKDERPKLKFQWIDHKKVVEGEKSK